MRTRWVAAVLAAVSAAFAILVAAGPAQNVRSSISWVPKSSVDSGVVLWTKGWPESFSVEIPCHPANFADAQVLSIGSFGLRNSRNSAVLSVNGLETLKIDSDSTTVTNCDTRATYESKTNQLTLYRDEVVVSHVIPNDQLPAVNFNTLSWTRQSADGVTANFVSRPISSAYSVTQWYFLLSSLTFAFLSVVLLLPFSTRVKRNKTLRIRKSESWRHKSVDAVVVVLLFAAAILTPMHYDDGAIHSIVRNFDVLGSFNSVYEPINPPTPLGYWSWWLTRFGFSESVPIVWLKIGIALVCFTAWLIASRCIFPYFTNVRSHKSLIVAGIGFSIYSAVWLVNLRAEAILVLLLSIQIAAALQYVRRQSLLSLTVIFLSFALAISHHQLGTAAIGPLLAISPTLFRQFRYLIKSLEIATIGLVACALTILLVFIKSDLTLLSESSSDFKRLTGHEFALGRFTDRLRWLLGYGAAAPRLFAFFSLVIFSFFVAYVVGKKRVKNIGSSVLIVLSPAIGLFLSASQWPWHLGVLATTYVAFIYLVVSDAHSNDESAMNARQPNWLLILLVLIHLLFASIALASTAGWAPFDLVKSTWQEFAETFGATADKSAFWILIILGIGLLLVVMEKMTGKKQLTTVFLSMTLLLPLVANFYWIGKDSVKTSEWSFARQSVAGLVGGNRCGILDSMPLIGDFRILPIDVTANLGNSDPIFPGGFDNSKSPSETPYAVLPSWGTWSPEERSNEKGFIGTTYSPWYSVSDGLQEISLWTLRGIANGTVLKIESRNRFGFTSIFEVPNQFVTGWKLFRYRLPRDTTSIRYEMYDPHPEEGAWVAVTAPISELKTFKVQKAQRKSVLVPLQDAQSSKKVFLMQEMSDQQKISNFYPVGEIAMYRTSYDSGKSEVIPRHQTAGHNTLTFLTASQQNTNSSLSLKFLDVQGEVIQTIKKPISNRPTFSSIAVDVPYNSETVITNISKDQGIVVVSPPLVESEQLEAEMNAYYHQVSILGLAAPCVPMPLTDTGLVPAVEYSVGQFNGIMTPVENGLANSKSEIGCNTEVQVCLMKYRYSLAPVSITKYVENN